MKVIEIQADSLEDALEMARSFIDTDRITELQRDARLFWTLARNMLALHGDTIGLRMACDELLEAFNPDKDNLTGETLADKFVRIAALPQPSEVTEDGDVWLATISDPVGDGSVWCKLPISDFTRRGLAKARQERLNRARIEAPSTRTPQ